MNNNNKYALYQIVKTTSDRIPKVLDMLGHIYAMNISHHTGGYAYGVIFENGTECWYEEEDIKATGDSLPNKVVQELYPEANISTYNFYEIVQHNISGATGFIHGISESGKSYCVVLLDNYEYQHFAEAELSSTGTFLSEEEIKKYKNNSSSITVTTEGEVTAVHINSPESWQERIITPDHITGWKEDEDK